MDSSLIILATAFGCGFIVSRIGLPPLIGFLGAGFLLNGMGIHSNDAIQSLAELGVTLLLFTIGLKLDIKSLIALPFWGSASVHISLTSGLFTIIILLFSMLGLPLFMSLDLSDAAMLAFALSFSSTVFAVKTLQEKGESTALYGQLAIAILVMQDIFAVLFLAFSTGKVPNIWVLTLLLLPVLRPLLYRILDRVGHGEMLVLYGLVLALTLGSGWFTLVGLKGDLGALVLGILLSGNKKSEELSRSLLALKDIFLIGFFLEIGMQQLPTTESVGLALLLLLLLPLKTVLYYLSIALFRFRVRTTLYSSFTLTNYSEFGLIVIAIAAQQGMMPSQWLTVVALALALSFVVAAPLNQYMGYIYLWLRPHLTWAQPEHFNTLDTNIRFGNSQFLIVGMGRIGTGAYEYLAQRFGKDAIFGIDSDGKRVEHHLRQGRHVLHANASDKDFWLKAELSSSLKAVFLAMPEHQGNYFAASYLNDLKFSGEVAAMVRYPDEGEALQKLGVGAVFNLYREAGAGFARDSCRILGLQCTEPSQPETATSITRL